MSKEVHWAQFFKEAGLPASIAKNYSIMFEENRISRDMLLDLNQDILVSMGITAMGDIINILKHAKKAHSQEAKRKDAVHTTKTMVVSSKRPPPPAAHSTTAKQAPAVSTTSSATKKKIVRKYPRHEVVPDSPSPELPAHPAHSARQTHPARRGEHREAEQDVTYVVLEPGHRVRSQQQQDQQEEEEEYLIEESTEPLELAPTQVTPDAGNASFESVSYEPRRPKRPMRMYSDEMEAVPQPKQPRVIILPGERRDIFTTSGLQKAAKVYESGGEPEGKLTSDRSRRLLESAGLIPSQDKTTSNSVFSRLDYKPSVSSHLTSPPTTSHPLTSDPFHPAAGISAKVPPTSSTITKTSRRIIKLTKRPSSSSSRPVPSLLAKPERSVSSTISPVRRITAESNSSSVISKPARTKASTSSSGVLVRRLISKAEESGAVLGRESVRRRAVSNPVPRGVKRQFSSEHVSFRSSSTSSSSSGGGGGGGREKRASAQPLKRSGVFGYDSDMFATPSSSSTTTLHRRENRSHGGGRGTRSKVKVKEQSSMVADEYEYQTQRQHDIRSRLEVRELAKRARRGGPLKGRLASHQVFHRLE